METNLVEEVMRMSTKKTHDELFEIGRKLGEDGLDPACKDEQKICYLWRIYLHTQTNLQLALATVKELQEQQSEEMTELENYVEHIRSLSEEREAITAEFEAENEALKGKVAQLSEDLQGYHNDDTREMLVEQGMDDIVDATHSEQIAYLLVERARLLDELEDTATNIPPPSAGSNTLPSGGDTIHTPEGVFSAGQIYQTLIGERQEFEKELASQRDNLRQAKEEMKMENEEEIEMMMGENENLQNLLNSSRKQVSQLQEQMDDLENQLEDLKDSSSPAPGQTTGSVNNAKINLLQSEISDLTIEKEALQDKVRVLSQEIDRRNTDHSEGESQISSLSQKNEDQLQLVKQLQIQLDRANAEKENLEEKQARNAVKVQKLQEELAQTDSGSDLRGSVDSAHLRRENRELLSEMDSLRGEMAAERIGKREAEGRARRGEAEVKDLKEEKLSQLSITQTKLKAMESKVEMAEAEQARCETEITRLKSEHKKELLSAAASVQSEMDDLRTNIRELNKVKRDMEREVSNCKLEIEMLQDKIIRGEEKHKRLGDDKTRLQQQMEDLNKKVSDVTKEKEGKEKIIQQEQMKNKDLSLASEASLAETQRNLERIKEDLQLTRAEMSRKEQMHEEAKSQLLKTKGNSDDTVTSLRQELVASKHQHQEDIFELTTKLDRNSKEIERLKENLESREQELSKVSGRLESLTEESKATQGQMERQLETEREKRAEMEGRNKSLEEEAARAWNKLQDNLEKLNRLENENDLLKSELQRKSSSCKDTEEQLTRRDAEREAELKDALNQADIAAKQLVEVERELEQVESQLHSAQQQLPQLQPLREELSQKEAELVHLRSQIHASGSQTTSLQETVGELKQQLSVSRDREQELNKANKDLQQLLMDVQGRLDGMKEQTSNAANLRNLAESNKKNLSEQVACLQSEMESLHAQLISAADKYDLQCKRYAERKLRTKNQLFKAREMYIEEKNKLRVENERLEQDLLLTRTALVKEREWKVHLEKSGREMLTEKRDLLTQLSESDEIVGDQRRQLSLLEVKSKYLEEENASLQERVDAVSKQKHNLDRVLKEYQMHRHNGEMRMNVSSSALALISPRTMPNNYHGDHFLADKHSNTITGTNHGHVTEYMGSMISPRIVSPLDFHRSENLATSFAMSDISQDSVTETP